MQNRRKVPRNCTIFRLDPSDLTLRQCTMNVHEVQIRPARPDLYDAHDVQAGPLRPDLIGCITDWD